MDHSNCSSSSGWVAACGMLLVLPAAGPPIPVVLLQPSRWSSSAYPILFPLRSLNRSAPEPWEWRALLWLWLTTPRQPTGTLPVWLQGHFSD